MTAARSANRPFRFSREQYYRLGELGFFDGKRVERIHGEIVEVDRVSWSHVVGARKTSDRMAEMFGDGAWINRGNPIPTDDSDPQPDVMVVPGRIGDYTDHPTSALMIVEVADTTLARDTTTKAELYATAGIADYWVLDLAHRELLVFRDPAPLPGGGAAYRTHFTLDAAESVSPLAMPVATVRVFDLLP